jgi:hypothetical protein
VHGISILKYGKGQDHFLIILQHKINKPKEELERILQHPDID